MAYSAWMPNSENPWSDDVGIVDTMIHFPWLDKKAVYDFLKSNLRDKESKEEFEFPAEYMFKEVPGAIPEGEDPLDVTLNKMDEFGIEWGLIGSDDDVSERALKRHPQRFLASTSVDPSEGRATIERIRRLRDTHDLRAVCTFPAGCDPQAGIGDAAWFPVYSVCEELGIPIFICTGVPGPRVPMSVQKTELLDEVCYKFPDLVIVTRHGCEPWEDLAVKLMVKWPNLHYSTSAFAPKHYPKSVIDYANSRGSHKVLYAGYFPMGLTLDRIFSELPHVRLNEDVWPKFLRDNAARILKVPT